jgi:hypothetical protein
MAKGIGKLFSFGVAKEATRGTAESSASYWIPWLNLDIQERDNKVLDEASIGVIEDSVDQKIVKQWAEGKWDAPIGDKHFPLILLASLGTISSALKSGETAVYDHTITVVQNAQHPSLTFFIDDPLTGADYKHALGVITSLEIKYELGKYLQYTANIKAKKGTSATINPATTSENKFLPQHLTFKLANNLAGLDTANAISLKSLSLKIEKNIEDDDVLGNIAPIDFLNKQFSIEGTLEAIWQNESDFKTIALSGTPKAMRIDLVNSDVTIGNSSNPRIKIDLAKVIFKEITRPVTVGDIVKQTLAFKAHYSISDNKMVTILVNNTVASY